MKTWFAGVFIVVAVFAFPHSAHAETDFKGLTLSPVSQELEVQTNKLTRSYIQLQNNSASIMRVDMSIQEFSATNYSYDFRLRETDVDWIRFKEREVILKPKETKKVHFEVNAPDTVGPGGHYFALIATNDFGGGAIQRTGEVISQLYVKVDGDVLVRGSIENPRVPFFVFDSSLQYKFDVRSTGNTHLVAVFYGRLEGLFLEPRNQRIAHVVLPGSIRTVGGEVATPFLPGLYKFTYGYSGEGVQKSSQETYVLYLPPWSIVAFVLLLMIAKWIWQIHRSRRKKDSN